MFNTQLFLGFPLSNSLYQIELESISDSIRSTFIQNASEETTSYLQKIEIDRVIYLGKYIGPIIETSSLDSIQVEY